MAFRTAQSHVRWKSLNWLNGSYIINGRAGNIIPELYHPVLWAHEIGHDLWRGNFNHLRTITTNNVPTGPPAGPTNSDSAPTNRLGYALMSGSGAAVNMAGNETISAYERSLLGWISCMSLSSSQNGLTVNDLYTNSSCYRIPLSGSSTGRTIYVSNQQRVGFFDRLFTYTSGSFYAEEGLMTTGLVIGRGQGSGSNVRYDELPADNTLDRAILNNVYQGDLYSPTTAKQITPWTRPNINGCNGYASDPDCNTAGYVPSWDAVDNIRYTGGTNGQMAFDYVKDFRTNPLIRAASWMGAETSGYTFTTDLVVAAGATLTIEAGTTLKFAAGKRIIVNGTLNVQGTSTSRVTLTSSTTTGSWNGIYFANGSSGLIRYADITRLTGGWASGAIAVSGSSSPSLEYSFIDVIPGSYVFGVSSSGGLSSNNPKVYKSIVRSASGPALYAVGSGGYISVHDSHIIQTSSYPAIHAENSGVVAAWIAATIYDGRNKIKGGRLYAGGNGRIDGGDATGRHLNHFCNSASATLEVASGGTIYAQRNYWPGGGTPTQINNGGAIYYGNNLGASNCSDVVYLASDAGSPGTDDAFALSAPGLFTVAAESATSDRREKLMMAKSMIYAGEHADAAGLLVELLQSEELPEAHTALLELGVLLRRGDFPGTLGVLRAIANRPGVLRATAMKMLADRDASRGQRADALAMLDSIQRQFPNTPDAFYAQLSVFYLYFETSLFEEAAKALSSVVPQNELEGLSVAAAHQLLSLEWDDVAASDAPVAFLSGDVGANAGDEMTLTLTNYPNPFNPVTSIQYQLPEESHVTLTVYDLMGRQVRLLVDDRQEAGSHRAMFDAEHLPSGVYLYRLQATGRSITGSMLLLK